MFFSAIELKYQLLRDRDEAVRHAIELRATAAITIEESRQAILRAKELRAELSRLRRAVELRPTARAPLRNRRAAFSGTP